jgi:hypothetical protein
VSSWLRHNLIFSDKQEEREDGWHDVLYRTDIESCRQFFATHCNQRTCRLENPLEMASHVEESYQSLCLQALEASLLLGQTDEKEEEVASWGYAHFIGVMAELKRLSHKAFSAFVTQKGHQDAQPLQNLLQEDCSYPSLDLSHQLALSTVFPEIEASYRAGRVPRSEVLDFILYTEASLRCIWRAPVPDTAALEEHGGLPALGFPSDHVALVADLVWR